MPAKLDPIQEARVGPYLAVILQHSDLAVTLLPEKGGEIHSVVYRPRQFDILWKSPWGLRKPTAASAATGGSEAAWMDSYGGGWQGIFPNGGDACTYSGAPLGFHGEASTAEWDYACSCDGSIASVKMSVRLARSPFHLIREVTIGSDSLSVVVNESIINEGEEAVSAMWGHHPAFATELVRGATIETSAKTYEPNVDSTTTRESKDIYDWPWTVRDGHNTVDLSKLPGSDIRTAEFGYLSGLDVGRYRLINRGIQLGVQLDWDHKLFPYLWYWLEWGGSFGYPFNGRCRVFALEPFSSIPGLGLTKALERGTALSFAPGERRSTKLRLTILPM